MPDSPDEAIFLLLSDLHFGTDLLAGGEGTLLGTPWYVRHFARDIQHYLNERCVGHDLNILKMLPRYLKLVLDDLRGEGYRRYDFDLYLVLGDMSTRPTGSSYRFLREYLTKSYYETGDANLKHKCAGLNIDPDRLIIIPGNHDKLLLTNLQLYQRELLVPIGLRAEPKRQSCFMLRRTVEGREFLFLLVEASKYATQDNYVDLSCREHLAGGEISSTLDTEIKTKLRKLKQGQDVDGVSLRDYTRTIKILLVHYAVDISRVVGTSQPECLILPHKCDGLAQLVDDLKPELDLVIHGHLHKPKLYEHNAVPVVAVTTTTQKNQERENGFFLLKFLRSGEVRAQHHRWLGTGFLLDDRTELNQLLYSPRAGAAPLA